MNLKPPSLLHRFSRSRGLAKMRDLIDFAKALTGVLPFDVTADEFTLDIQTPHRHRVAFDRLIGPIGKPGQPGLRGPVGPHSYGPPGELGTMGSPGADGDPGTDPGPPGRPGLRGRDGRAGRDGRNGVNARNGVKGMKGDPGPNSGEIGDPGDPGADGDPGILLDGEPGDPGPDAAWFFIYDPPGSPGEKGDPGDPGIKLAIVESCGSCVGFHVQESPSFYFVEHLRVEIPRHSRQVTAPIDPLWLETLDPRSGVEILSVYPHGIAAEIDPTSSFVMLHSPLASRHTRTAIITLQGIARGRHGRRFPEFTRDQKEANQRFWSSAFNFNSPSLHDSVPFHHLPDNR